MHQRISHECEHKEKLDTALTLNYETSRPSPTKITHIMEHFIKILLVHVSDVTVIVLSINLCSNWFILNDHYLQTLMHLLRKRILPSQNIYCKFNFGVDLRMPSDYNIIHLLHTFSCTTPSHYYFFLEGHSSDFREHSLATLKEKSETFSGDIKWLSWSLQWKRSINLFFGP